MGVTEPQSAYSLEIVAVATRLALHGCEEASCTRQVGLARAVHPDPGGEMSGQYPSRNRACTDERREMYPVLGRRKASVVWKSELCKMPRFQVEKIKQ
jgi:hypothetical protein